MNTLIYLVAAVLCAGLGVRAWARDRTHPARRAFLALALLSAACFGSFTLYLLPGLNALRYLYFSAGAMLPAALLSYLEHLFGPPDELAQARARRAWGLAAVGVLAFLALDLSTVGPRPGPSFARALLGVGTIGGFGACLARLWDAHQRTDQEVQRVRIRYLLGFLAAAVASTTLELLARQWVPVDALRDGSALARASALQGAAPPAGAVIGAIFIYINYQVLQLYRLLDLHEVFVRLVVLAVSASVLLLIDGVVVFGTLELNGWPLQGAFQLLLASALFLSAYDPLRARLEALGFSVFRRQARRLERALTEVDRALASVIRLEGLEAELLGRLHASGRAPVASLYLWDTERGLYRLRLCKGTHAHDLMPTIASAPFTEGFHGGIRGYAAPELRALVKRRLPGHEDAGLRLRTMEAMQADLTLPVRSGGRVLGWLNLKDEPWSDGYSREELRRLLQTVDKVALVVENIESFEALEEQDRLAALGTMAAGLAHEIRNPLAGIKGAAQYVRKARHDADPEDLDELLDVIVDETDRLASVVNQFLDYARPLTLQAAPAALPELVERVLAVVRAQGLPPGVQLRAEADGELPPCAVDVDKLHQVLLNLVQNAVEAVGTAGEVRVALRATSLTDPRSRGRPAVEIAVVDDGPGVPPEHHEKLFIPFFTTRPGGTGLGLAISRRLVEAHGGELTLAQAPSGGAEFRVRIPTDPLSPTPATPEVRGEAPPVAWRSRLPRLAGGRRPERA